MICIHGIDNLETAVRISNEPGRDRQVLLMNRKEHFDKYANTEAQILEDDYLKDRLIVVRDEEMKDTPASSTLVR